MNGHIPPWPEPLHALASAIVIPIEGFEVCWAGPIPNGFCFGSEDGRVFFTDVENNPICTEPAPGSVSKEAVNGFATVGGWVAVSTRNEANIWSIQEKKPRIWPSSVGAFGVMVTAGGHFVFPLGRNGMMVLDPKAPNLEFVVYDSPNDAINFYRTISVVSGGREVLVSACRSGGVAVKEYPVKGPDEIINRVAFDNLDIVDVCALAPTGNSLAACAIAKDGSLVFFNDAMTDRSPIVFNYSTIKGTAYRVFSTRGHLLVLTSEGVYVLAKMVEQFLEAVPFGSINSPVLTLPIEAVDANLCGDTWLLVVMPDGVLRIDIRLIDKSVPETISSGQAKPTRPTSSRIKVTRGEVQQGRKPLVAAS